VSRAGLVAPGAQRGVALLLVVWLIALLTALIGAFAISARVESLQGRVLAQGSVVQQIARAGLEYALQRVADPDPGSRWTPMAGPTPGSTPAARCRCSWWTNRARSI